jgi:hypothetical protein
METLAVGTELFHADRRTDTTKLVVAFRSFTYAPKMDSLYSIHVGLLSQILLKFIIPLICGHYGYSP